MLNVAKFHVTVVTGVHGLKLGLGESSTLAHKRHMYETVSWPPDFQGIHLVQYIIP